jgi:tetratricopeptide (TPR) repeat protein
MEEMLSPMQQFVKDYTHLRRKRRRDGDVEAFLAGLREYLVSGACVEARPIGLFIKGRVALEEGDLDHAELFFDELLHTQQELEEPGARVIRAWALFDKALICRRKGASDDVAAAMYDEMITELNDAKDPELQEWHATALLKKANISFRQGGFDEVIALCDQIDIRYRGFEEFEVREVCVRASLYKGLCLANQGERDLAIMQYDDFLARFADSRYNPFDKLTIQVLGYKAEALMHRKRFDEALMSCNDLLERAGYIKDSEVREFAAIASLNKAEILAAQGNADEAVSILNEIQCSLQDAQEPQFDKIIALAGSKAESLAGRRNKDRFSLRPSVLLRICMRIRTVVRCLRKSVLDK